MFLLAFGVVITFIKKIVGTIQKILLKMWKKTSKKFENSQSLSVMFVKSFFKKGKVCGELSELSEFEIWRTFTN